MKKMEETSFASRIKKIEDKRFSEKLFKRKKLERRMKNVLRRKNLEREVAAAVVVGTSA